MIPTIIDRLLFATLNALRVPRKHVGPDDSPDLYRFRLLRFRGRQVVLHRFLRPDNPAYGMHDHPWSFASIVLIGEYTERFTYFEVERIPVNSATTLERLTAPIELTVLKGTLKRTPGTVGIHDALYRHIIASGVFPCWTICVFGKTRRTWGFPDTIGDTEGPKYTEDPIR